MATETATSKTQTIIAVLASVAIFGILLYVVFPIVEALVIPLIDWFGRYFVPERYGGGREVDNPGFLKLAGRAAIFSALSAFGGLKIAFFIFDKPHTQLVLAIFGCTISVWVTYVAYATFIDRGFLACFLVVVTGGLPPLGVVYLILREDLREPSSCPGRAHYWNGRLKTT